jgi:hypothetical protein
MKDIHEEMKEHNLHEIEHKFNNDEPNSNKNSEDLGRIGADEAIDEFDIKLENNEEGENFDKQAKSIQDKVSLRKLTAFLNKRSMAQIVMILLIVAITSSYFLIQYFLSLNSFSEMTAST